jgi:nicotinamide mononucleotide adenylyltransferase
VLRMKDDKKKKKRFDSSKYINLEPKLNEAKTDTVVLTFGRFSPPTVGHEKLVNKIASEAKSRKATPLVFASHTFDKKKNPLSYDKKISYLQKAFGKIVQKSSARTIIEVAKELNGKFANLIVVVGADRVPEFERLLTTYNGKEYNYKNIEIISAGDRDPDADDVSGMSASKLRALVVAGDFDTFQKGVPTKLKPSAKEIYDELRKNMGLEEEIVVEEVLDEAPLTVQQRRQRGRTMKRYASRIARARERAARRKASPEKLKVRARRKAREVLRKRFLQNKTYAELTPTEKIQIDKRLQRIPDTVLNRIATRQLPAVRKAEMERLASLRSAKKEESLDDAFENFISENLNESFESFLAESPARYHSGVAASTADKRKAHFNKGAEKHWDDPSAYEKAPGDATAETKPSKYTKRYHQLFTKEGTVKHDKRFKFNRQKENIYFKELEESTDAALDKKAEETGISRDILKQVFRRGVAAWRTGHRPGTTPEQWGFARVNSFATGGKTQKTADADLWAKHKGKNESFLDDAMSLMEAVEAFVEAKDTEVKPFVSFKTPDYSTPVSKHIKHHLGVGVSPEHMRKDAVRNIDLDYDGDVDDQEKNPAVEFGGDEKQNMTKLIRKKMSGEIKHTKRGLAFEAVDKKDPKNREYGTDSLVKILKDDTPGQKNEAYFDNDLGSEFGNFNRGSKVRFAAHSLDMADGDGVKEGTVVGSTVQHLRVRSEDGILYKVRHKDAELIEESMTIAEEFINFEELSENLLDKAVEAVRKHVTKGKSLEDVIWEFSAATGFKIPTKELYNQYIKTHGNPSALKTVSADHKAALMRKYI